MQEESSSCSGWRRAESWEHTSWEMPSARACAPRGGAGVPHSLSRRSPAPSDEPHSAKLSSRLVEPDVEKDKPVGETSNAERTHTRVTVTRVRWSGITWMAESKTRYCQLTYL